MPQSSIAIGGVLKTRADEDRLIEEVALTQLPIQMGGEGSEMSADEPPGDDGSAEGPDRDADWYHETVRDLIAKGQVLVLETWVDDDDLFEDTKALEQLLKELGLSWRVFDNGLSKVDQVHNGVSGQPVIALHLPDGPEGGEGVLVDLVREPLVLVPRPLDEAGQAELLNRGAKALRVIDYPLPGLTRAFETT